MRLLTKTTLKKVITALSFTVIATQSFTTSAEIISSKQVVDDITFLASDSMRGRANFSPEIKQAAKYIGQRFNDIGLSTLTSDSASSGYTRFYQHFNVTQIHSQSLHVSINNQMIAPENLAIASTMENVNWQQLDDVNVHVINEKDNMREQLQQFNMQGSQHLVVINSAHKKLFSAYKNYFDRGLTKLSLSHQGTIIIALADDINITNLDIKAKNKIETKALTNVVGVLPGTSKAHEIVLYSSHYDHLGTTEDGKAIYNGADDDASGTTAIMNLAQYYAKQGNNKRTLIFSAFAAEEIGGFGSQYFAQQLNADSVIAMINIEMIGKPSKFGQGTVWMTGMERSNLGELLNKSLAPLNREIFQDPYPEQGLFYRSDNATLARLGVPAHSFSSTQLDKDQHYHQTSDDISSLDLKSMHLVIESLATATQPLVDGIVTPTRVDKAKVRAKGKIY